MERCLFSNNLSIFFGTDKISAGELDQIFSTQRCEQTGKTKKKSNKDNKKTRKQNPYGKTERIRVYQLQEEKTKEQEMHLHLEAITKDEGSQFILSSVDKTRNNCLKLQKKRLM